MVSLDETFKDLQQRLQHGRELGGTGTDPIFYLVFPVTEILAVKRKFSIWKSQLELQSWEVTECSMHKVVQDAFNNHKHRNELLLGEKLSLEGVAGQKDGIQTKDITATLTAVLTEGKDIVLSIQQALKEASSKQNGILFITDLEALHPFIRINSIEAKMHGLVDCPVVVLYPGKRDGRTSLKFLEIFPPDPNYRSEHLG